MGGRSMASKVLEATARVLSIAIALAWAATASATSPEAAATKAEEALSNAFSLERPHQIGLAAVFDGNKYVQCRRLSDRTLRCEAGGALMQRSLAHVLTPA